MSQKEQRPWGNFTILSEGKDYKVKLLTVDPGQRTSLQRHVYRNEHWIIVEGTANIVRGRDNLELGPNSSIYVVAGTTHRIENLNEEPLKLVEVQYGKVLDENDIERLEDSYGRT